MSVTERIYLRKSNNGACMQQQDNMTSYPVEQDHVTVAYRPNGCHLLSILLFVSLGLKLPSFTALLLLQLSDTVIPQLLPLTCV